MAKRNEMAEDSLVKRMTDVTSATKGKSAYDAGATIYRSNNHTLASGNCGEMACVASYIAITTFAADTTQVWFGAVRGRGDHAFCLVGAKPAETTVKKMANLSVVIDPWLNVCTTAAQYSNAAEAKLKKGHQQGKRVAFTGSQGPGWYCTGGEYTERFMTEPLGFSLAKP